MKTKPITRSITQSASRGIGISFSKAVQAQTVVIDVDDNHGDSDYVGIRRVLFYLRGVVLQILQAHFTAYATSRFSADFDPKYIFDWSLSRIGAASTKSWKSALISGDKKQRVSCVFSTPKRFDKIVVDNYHDTGSSNTTGAKDIKIYTTMDSVTSTVHDEGVSKARRILSSALAIHPAEDVVDEQPLVVLPTPIAPVNTVAPVISGDFEEGEVLSCTTGTWTGTASVFTYQWQSDEEDIDGETGSTYTLTEDDLESSITCIVTAKNGAGSVEQDSNNLSAVPPGVLGSQVYTQIDSGATVDGPVGLSIPSFPSTGVGTSVISETPASNTEDLSVPPVPSTTVTTIVE